MAIDVVLASGSALGLVAYLFYVLARPERF